jgi:hypothetical protein
MQVPINTPPSTFDQLPGHREQIEHVQLLVQVTLPSGWTGSALRKDELAALCDEEQAS